MQEVIMLCAIPCAGKSTISKKYIEQGYISLNRDTLGGKIIDLIPRMEQALNDGYSVILDNTNVTKEGRVAFITMANSKNVSIRAMVLDTSMEDIQYNASLRILQKCGKMLSPDELKKNKDPNIFPPSVIFGFQKRFEMPTVAEGFDSVEHVPFVRSFGPEYKNRALICDYDSTLRITKSGVHYPTETNDIEILPNRTEILQKYKDEGYLLLGVSNQSGIHSGKLSNGAAKACFEKTNKLLGHDIDYVYCPHQSNPISCYCRKPFPFWPVYFIEKYHLDRTQVIFVGDLTTDKTCAKRAGIKFIHESEFFK